MSSSHGQSRRVRLRQLWRHAEWRWENEMLDLRLLCGSLDCSRSAELFSAAAFLSLAVDHSKEKRIAASDWFEPFIGKLRLARDKQEMKSMFFDYIYTPDRESPPVLRNAVLRLAWMKNMEPFVSFILAVWKNLAKSQAGYQILDSGPLKTLRAVVDIYNEHCEDWKAYKKEVIDAGQVHLVEQLVRPFWGESPLRKS
jgi:hypothetical protein